MSFGEIPESYEASQASPQAVVENLLPQFENCETESQVIDALLELKLQCFESGVDFSEAQTVLTAGLGPEAYMLLMRVGEAVVKSSATGLGAGLLS